MPWTDGSKRTKEVFVHPRDPYKRIDILHSSRHVEVEVNGVKIADTRRPTLLFETSLPTRYYMPKLDVRMDLLFPTNTVTGCAYKGFAEYWSVAAGSETFKDLAWSYKTPLPDNVSMANSKFAGIFRPCRDLGRIRRCATWPSCFCIC
jgi:uncharacterized protein (DUF427 family)